MIISIEWESECALCGKHLKQLALLCRKCERQVREKGRHNLFSSGM